MSAKRDSLVDAIYERVTKRKTHLQGLIESHEFSEVPSLLGLIAFFEDLLCKRFDDPEKVHYDWVIQDSGLFVFQKTFGPVWNAFCDSHLEEAKKLVRADTEYNSDFVRTMKHLVQARYFSEIHHLRDAWNEKHPLIAMTLFDQPDRYHCRATFSYNGDEFSE